MLSNGLSGNLGPSDPAGWFVIDMDHAKSRINRVTSLGGLLL